MQNEASWNRHGRCYEEGGQRWRRQTILWRLHQILPLQKSMKIVPNFLCNHELTWRTAVPLITQYSSIFPWSASYIAEDWVNMCVFWHTLRNSVPVVYVFLFKLRTLRDRQNLLMQYGIFEFCILKVVKRSFYACQMLYQFLCYLNILYVYYH